MICIVSAAGSSTTATLPAPGELLGGGGTSFAAERMPPKVIGIARAAGAGSIRAAVNASKQDRVEMRGSDSFMFASFAEELGTGSYDRVGGHEINDLDLSQLLNFGQIDSSDGVVGNPTKALDRLT